jgi:hypothetical protein
MMITFFLLECPARTDRSAEIPDGLRDRLPDSMARPTGAPTAVVEKIQLFSWSFSACALYPLSSA